MRKRFVAVVAGLAVAVSGLVVSVPEAQAASWSVSPLSVSAGGYVQVNGTGFGQYTVVRFSLSGPQSRDLGSVQASYSGLVSKPVLVPPDVVAGSYTFTISWGSGVQATSILMVSSSYHLLRFDASGGSVSTSSRSALSGAALGVLPTPSRAGYTFAGWFTARSGGAKVTSVSRMGSTDTTLFAHWAAKKFTVKFSANGGKKPSSKSKRVTMGHSYGKLPSVKRTGYSFLGWFTAKSGGVKVTSGSTFTKAATQSLFAHWKAKSYKVKLKAQGGKVSKSSIRVTYHATYKSLPTPSRSGYSFKGWYTKKSGGTKITNSSKVKITKTQTLYAHWKKTKTYVSYLANKDMWSSGNQISCGENLCIGEDVFGLMSAKMTVSGAAVQVKFCVEDNGVGFISSQKTCDDHYYMTWRGTRKGNKAVVSNGTGSGTFLWGVVTFAGSKASSKATRFVTADSCQRMNGSYGTFSTSDYRCH